MYLNTLQILSEVIAGVQESVCEIEKQMDTISFKLERINQTETGQLNPKC